MLREYSALAPLWPTFHFRSVMFYQVSMIYCSCIKADEYHEWYHLISMIHDINLPRFPCHFAAMNIDPLKPPKRCRFFPAQFPTAAVSWSHRIFVPVEFFLQKASPCRCSSASLSLAVWHSSPMDPAPYSWQISMKEWRNMKDREWYSDDLPMDQGGMWAGFSKPPCLHGRGSFAPLPTSWIKSELPLT